MRELTMNEVQDVNGGYFWRAVAAAYELITANKGPADGNAASAGEMPDYNK